MTRQLLSAAGQLLDEVRDPVPDLIADHADIRQGLPGGIVEFRGGLDVSEGLQQAQSRRLLPAPSGGLALTPRRRSPAGLLGRTRARRLTALDQPLSTTAVAATHDLSPAGASRHLLALRDAGLATAARHGHEVRYSRTELGSMLLQATEAEPGR